MSTLRLTRRHALWLAATGAALASSNLARAAIPALQPARKEGARPSADDPAWGLIAPLREGSMLGPWRVVAMTPVRAGAITVVVANAQGQNYAIDICQRDDSSSAPVPPARTAHYDIFVVNEGSGNTPTREEHGLAAMALAEVIRSNESSVRPAGLATHRQRLAGYSDQIMKGI
jgi:hypothetical protein